MGFRVQGLGFGVSGLAHEDAMGRARVRVSICTYVRIYVCMYVGMHVCMYACMHVCMYVRMYVCVLAIYIYIYIYIYKLMAFVQRSGSSLHVGCERRSAGYGTNARHVTSRTPHSAAQACAAGAAATSTTNH